MVKRDNRKKSKIMNVYSRKKMSLKRNMMPMLASRIGKTMANTSIKNLKLALFSLEQKVTTTYLCTKRLMLQKKVTF